MVDRWDRLKSIVQDAAALAPHDREPFLSEACAGDAELRDRAKTLLEGGLQEDNFLTPLVGEDAGLPAGTHVGAFTIVRTLACGGMGMVFEATQETPARRVALKVMRDGLFTAASRERFRYEIDALGSLNHPGIAQIFEAGIHQDQDAAGMRELPWFAMEYVEGARTVRQYAMENDLDRDGCVSLIAQIADSVQHGHQKGVIHRDLKPDNLLVSKSGRPTVIDFGVAKLADAEARWTTLKTGSQEIVGTLAYMSPEQARGGSADVRSDVYALGVVLYELLIGRLPIDVDSTDFVTSARRIAEDSPRRPSSVRPELTGDIEAILLKALEKEPERRYESAAALASDLKRLLRREPVQARIPTRWYQVRAFARRNRVLVGMSAVVLVVLVAASAVSIGFALHSQRAERIALHRTDEAQTERDRASELFHSALERHLRVTFKAVPRMHRLPGGAQVAGEVMQATVRDLEALAEKSGDAPAVQLALAEANRKLGDILGNPVYANLGEAGAAQAAYTRALGLTAALHGHPVYGQRARFTSMRVLRKRGETRGGHKLDDQAIADLHRARDLGESLLIETPGAEDVRTHLALVHKQLGLAWCRGMQLELAETHGREAVRLQEGVWNDHSERVLNADLLAEGIMNLARILMERRRLEEASEILVRAVTLVEGVLDRSDDPRRTEGTLAMLRGYCGGIALERNDFDLAEALLGPAKDRAIAQCEGDPKDVRLRIGVCAKLIDWVLIPERRLGPTPDGRPPEEARRRAKEAAETIERLAPSADSKMVKIFARQLREYAEGESKAGSLTGSFSR